jgi:hypothetical protein
LISSQAYSLRNLARTLTRVSSRRGIFGYKRFPVDFGE